MEDLQSLTIRELRLMEMEFLKDGNEEGATRANLAIKRKRGYLLIEDGEFEKFLALPTEHKVDVWHHYCQNGMHRERTLDVIWELFASGQDERHILVDAILLIEETSHTPVEKLILWEVLTMFLSLYGTRQDFVTHICSLEAELFPRKARVMDPAFIHHLARIHRNRGLTGKALRAYNRHLNRHSVPPKGL